MTARTLFATYKCIPDYFDRIKHRAEEDKAKTNLRQDELLYDEAFNIVKVVLPSQLWESRLT